MRKTTLPFVAFLLTSALLFAAYQSISPSGARAESALTTTTGVAAGSPGSCSLSTLKGRYLFAHSGTILPPAFGVSEATPGADAGIHIFNGDGTGTDIVTVRVGSQIFLNNATVPFTYTVNADCTGEYRVQIDNGPAFNLFAAPNGDSVVMISTEPPVNSYRFCGILVEKPASIHAAILRCLVHGQNCSAHLHHHADRNVDLSLGGRGGSPASNVHHTSRQQRRAGATKGIIHIRPDRFRC